jgi:hypothetical protein
LRSGSQGGLGKKRRSPPKDQSLVSQPGIGRNIASR